MSFSVQNLSTNQGDEKLYEGKNKESLAAMQGFYFIRIY
jgi:hypothetical protein